MEGMRRTWCIADCVISPLGNSTAENYANVSAGNTGIDKIADGDYHASLIKNLVASEHHTRFETIALQSIQGALQNLTLDKQRTILILSTTKGNVEHLHVGHPRLALHASARHIAETVGIPHSIVVSNACISGVLALITAKRLLHRGVYDHAVIVGAEVLSEFIVNGFKSLFALATEPCKPFDSLRSGITLGEAAGTVVLSTQPGQFFTNETVEITGIGLSNDANHISGPSRTGKELALAIEHALHVAKIRPSEIDSISAHGTATRYNDEMEAQAFKHAELQAAPLHSLKGNFGHTLGAAGIIETIMAKQALLNNEILPTKGFSTLGVSQPLRITTSIEKSIQQRILKTASGFGGCNAALILEKNKPALGNAHSNHE